MIGKSTFTYSNGTELKFEGEINKAGKACGTGTMTQVNQSNWKITGTFLDNMSHGICR